MTVSDTYESKEMGAGPIHSHIQNRLGRVLQVVVILSLLTALLVGSSALAITAAADGLESDAEPTPSVSDVELIQPEDRTSASIADSPAPMVTSYQPSVTDAALLLVTYTRYNDISPLEHDVRADIVAIVLATPGLYLAQVVNRLDHPSSTIRYHLRVLEREDDIQTERLWGHVRLYPSDLDRDTFPYLAMRQEPATARIFNVVDEAEPITVGDIAAAVDRAPSTVSHHLDRLESASLIERERCGEQVRVSLAPDLESIRSQVPDELVAKSPKLLAD